MASGPVTILPHDPAWARRFAVEGRRYLEADRGAAGAVHVHAFVAGHQEIQRHLDFRDDLLAHPRRAAAYGRLKRHLAARFGSDRAGYGEAKTPFIRETEALARAWRRSSGLRPPPGSSPAST